MVGEKGREGGTGEDGGEGDVTGQARVQCRRWGGAGAGAGTGTGTKCGGLGRALSDGRPMNLDGTLRSCEAPPGTTGTT